VALLSLAPVPWLSPVALAARARLASSLASSGGSWHPRVVQERETAVAGGPNTGVEGPFTVHARFDRPTTAGDLLVAAVIDGVQTSGMTQPEILLPHWTLGHDVIGGNTADGGTGSYATGGLQSAIYLYPDNPGGLLSLAVAEVPRGTASDVTVVLAEVSGVPRKVSVDVTGGSSSGPTVGTDSTKSAVSTDQSTTGRDDLVLAAFTNGGDAQNGERFTYTSGWHLIGENTAAGNIDEPVLFDYRLQQPGVAGETLRYAGGSPIDNCAVIVALD
jgi:hypothetical protein